MENDRAGVVRGSFFLDAQAENEYDNVKNTWYTNWNLTADFGTRVDRRLAPRIYEGVPKVAQTGGGGSPSPIYLSQKRNEV